MRWTICLLMLSVAPNALVTGQDKKAPASPLTLKIVNKSDSYALALSGTSEDLRKEIAKSIADKNPLPPTRVKLELEFKNVGTKDLTFILGGDQSEVDFDLKGNGAVTEVIKRAFTREFRAGKKVKLAPGKTHVLEIDELAFGKRNEEKAAWFVEYGPYTLGAKFRTSISPAPEGTTANDGFGTVTIVADPIDFRVKNAN